MQSPRAPFRRSALLCAFPPNVRALVAARRRVPHGRATTRTRSTCAIPYFRPHPPNPTNPLESPLSSLLVLMLPRARRPLGYTFFFPLSSPKAARADKASGRSLTAGGVWARLFPFTEFGSLFRLWRFFCGFGLPVCWDHVVVQACLVSPSDPVLPAAPSTARAVEDFRPNELPPALFVL